MSDKLRQAAVNAHATLRAIYVWVDKVNAANKAGAIAGAAMAHQMLKSLNKNRGRVVTLVEKPLKEALDELNKKEPGR